MLAWCGGGSSDDDVATDGSGNWSGGLWEKGLRSFRDAYFTHSKFLMLQHIRILSTWY